MTPLLRPNPHFLTIPKRLASRQVLDNNYVIPDGRVLRIQRAEPEDKDALFTFYRDNFSVQEPISRYLKITFEDLEGAFYGPIFDMALKQGLSTAAYDGDKLVGVSIVTLNPVEQRTLLVPQNEFGIDADKYAKQLGTSVNGGILYSLLMHGEAISVSLLPEEITHLVRAEAGSVSPDYRGADVRRKLAIESAKLAASEGYEVIDTLCSATASTKVMGDCGLVTRHKMVYKDMTYHGKPIFPTPLHDDNTSMNVMQGSIKDLSTLECPKESTIQKYKKRMARN
ncbi:unnamed protein product [Bursaphelenchus okinawaensis]|uniref:N-acetyltransferase domain-containing protein n=1 Tax=Bursaphelenchus okinawaensis TaxID=465554 RepID=A0A811JRN9_9BILA|nr:unnamed protein product [Bursaphelenchus okinawaensis]CAG9079337.1 unnamed protein product [Bursaphelenchus okinawaensis]